MVITTLHRREERDPEDARPAQGDHRGRERALLRHQRPAQPFQGRGAVHPTDGRRSCCLDMCGAGECHF